MKWHNICHAKLFSPNLGRSLKSSIPVQLYKTLYSSYKHYDQFERNSLNVYTSFLHETIKCFREYEKLNSILEELKEHISYPQTYGVKLDEGGVLRLEIYFYYNKRPKFNPQLILEEYSIFLNILKKHGADISLLKNLLADVPLQTSTIWSFNFFDNEMFFDKQISIYTENKIKDKDIVYWGNQYTKDLEGSSKEGLFLCFHKDYKLDLITDLNYNFTDYQINSAEHIMKNYSCKEYNISNKKESNGETIFFVQYFGISDHDYERFLVDNKYPKSLINHYLENKLFYKTMSKEITEVYKIGCTNFNKFRCGFYGLI